MVNYHANPVIVTLSVFDSWPAVPHELVPVDTPTPIFVVWPGEGVPTNEKEVRTVTIVVFRYVGKWLLNGGSDVTYFDLCALNGICRQLGGTWNDLCNRMKNAWSGTYGSIAGPSRLCKSGMICVLLNFNVVESNCVRK